jgi:hypothetical protein
MRQRLGMKAERNERQAEIIERIRAPRLDRERCAVRPIALAVHAAHDTAAPKATGIRAKITGAKIAGNKITGSLAASFGSSDPKWS